ncbi:MAG: hypothetical protein OXI37_04265 [Gammaproteobacteria bacterium]|nr:hypothetical protein [Gammaproteobacteria bacterium]
MNTLIDKLVDVVTAGNRPFRILLFGGIFMGLLIMNLLARLFGIKTDIGGDVNLANIVLIVISLLAGFGISYCLVHLADASKRRLMQK